MKLKLTNVEQWLFIVCPKCNHQWSLWKLGFSRGTRIKPIHFEHQNDDPNYDPLIGSKLDLEMQIEDKKFSSEMLLEDLGKACIEKVELQGKLAQIQIFCENRLIVLAQHDPNWNIDYIPEEMLKRDPEINSLNSILNLLKSH